MNKTTDISSISYSGYLMTIDSWFLYAVDIYKSDLIWIYSVFIHYFRDRDNFDGHIGLKNLFLTVCFMRWLD